MTAVRQETIDYEYMTSAEVAAYVGQNMSTIARKIKQQVIPALLVRTPYLTYLVDPFDAMAYADSLSGVAPTPRLRPRPQAGFDAESAMEGCEKLVRQVFLVQLGTLWRVRFDERACIEEVRRWFAGGMPFLVELVMDYDAEEQADMFRRVINEEINVAKFGRQRERV